MPNPLNPLTFPLHGDRLIEASAGTGKTYTIAALYLRLVLGHGDGNGFGRPLTPPEILVVTFTNAATGELRDRIRGRLTQAAAFFRDDTDGDDLLDSLRDAYPSDTWLDQARLLDQAAQWMDEAAIHTIHGWSQRMLQQHAFDSNSPFDLTLEPNDQGLLEEAARDYWRTFFYPLAPDRLRQALNIVECDTPEQWLAKLRPLLKESFGQPEQDPFAMLDEMSRAMDTARKRWAPDLDEAVDRLWEARHQKRLNGNQYREKSFTDWLHQLTQWVRMDGPLPDDTARFKLSASGLAAGTNKNASPPLHRAYEIFDDLNDELERLDVKTAFHLHGAVEIARRYEQEKARRGQMNYDDLLTRLAQGLVQSDGDRLARSIRRQFPVALIDEFQDTDPVQFDTFHHIYMGRPDTCLVMIGDPKQAIYRFRGADIYTYLRARRATNGRHYTLSTNYRSTAGLVASVNQMFQSPATSDQGPFLFKSQIPFEPVDAHEVKARVVIHGRPAESMTWWTLSQTEPVAKTTQEGYLPLMAEAFATRIANLLCLADHDPPEAGIRDPDGRIVALRPEDIAVLVRDGYEADAITRALNRRGVSSVYLSDRESIFQTEEAADTLFLLTACAEPSRDGAIRAALVTSVIGLPLDLLDRLFEDDIAWENQVENFRRYRLIWQQRGVLPMLRTLLHDFGVFKRLLASEDGERSVTNLLHLAELLQGASTGLTGHQALIRWLCQQMKEADGTPDDQILRLESDADRVRVVTIHKSKGLEYPLVFLPFVCSFRKVSPRNHSMVQVHDDQNRQRLVMAPTEADYEEADRERLAEDLRLLYVAVTRAKLACWLGIAVMGRSTKRGETTQLHLSGLGYLLSGPNPIATGDLSTRLEALKGDCGEITIESLPEADDRTYTPRPETIPLSPARSFRGHISKDWWIASYSGIVSDAGRTLAPDQEIVPAYPLSTAAHSATEDQLQETKVESFVPSPPVAPGRSIHQFPKGPQPGTFLHDLLEWAAIQGFGALAQNRQRIIDRLAPLCRRYEWEPWLDTLADWLQRLLTTPFPLPEEAPPVSLNRLKTEAYQPELEFLFAAHGLETAMLDHRVTTHTFGGAPRPQLQPATVNGMLKGFIDLAFCHDGRYYVLDYKSNHLGEDEQAYVQDAIARAMMEHRYDLQYVLYTLAMHRLLKARLPGYDYGRHMGGGVYLFLRGVNDQGRGVFVDKPPWPLIQTLDAWFSGRKDPTHDA